MTTSSTSASVPEGLVEAVVDLVGTGAVQLGAYTLAELVAVDAIVDFLEAEPAEEALTEAVRSLAARRLLVAAPDGNLLHVRGDLGIALTFQQRARVALDARVTGTSPGERWRVLFLPQPEGITLEIGIDAIGVHEVALHPSEEALDRLLDWLPRGGRAPEGSAGADEVLAGAERSALVTVTGYTAQGSVEVADTSTDLVLARTDGDLHVFARDPDDPSRLVAQDLDDDGVRDALTALLAQPPAVGRA